MSNNTIDKMTSGGSAPHKKSGSIVAGSSRAALNARLAQDAQQTNAVIDAYLTQRGEFIEKKLGIGSVPEPNQDPLDFSALFLA
jgi:hypothetical protein